MVSPLDIIAELYHLIVIISSFISLFVNSSKQLKNLLNAVKNWLKASNASGAKTLLALYIVINSSNEDSLKVAISPFIIDLECCLFMSVVGLLESWRKCLTIHCLCT